ncbi:hypothetical protein EST38_g2863 [Candolleomyces aberdarensis]|uniref:F-box domain-containing protein n=1 Tax=Candolleomyces aberdarensis TaxID=2316362 RepID=A0A4Q2DTG8_9AGAR|nr:hypothetical protein EST38_g2863 [Candolleomyces aberdarensis]
MSRFEVNGLDHLYSTNVVPKPVEAAYIQRQVNILTSSILQLQSQLKDLQDQLGRHRGVLSPLRQFPVEVLSEIFTFVVPYVLGDYDRQDMLNLALVCKNWRNAVFLAHRLWSGLEVTLRTLPACSKITGWFGRSGNVPRTLKFVSHWHKGCTAEGSQCKRWAVPVAKLLTRGPSLHHLALDLSGIECFRSIVEALESCKVGMEQRPWDSVKKFTLSLQTDCNEPPPPSESIYKLLPPSVTSFHLTLPSAWDITAGEWELQDIFFTMPLHVPSSFLETLTTFFISCNWPGRQLFEVLQKCVNVLALTIDLQHEGPPYDLQDPFFLNLSDVRLVLPEVRTLRIHRCTPAGIHVLDFLQAPRLVALDLGFQGGGASELSAYHDFIEILQNLLLESECEETFQSFRLANARIKTQELKRLFSSSLCSIVIHLTLEDVTLVDELEYWDLYRFLSWPDHLPFLKTLELLRLPRLRSYIHELLDFLKERQPLEKRDGKVVLPTDGSGVSLLEKLVVTFEKDDSSLPRDVSLDDDERALIQEWRRYAHMFVSIGSM